MEIPSFNALIQQSIIDHWDMDALTDYKGATLQYHDVARKIEKLHIMFENSGVVKGDKIALCGRNSANWAVAFLATLTYGAIAVPILHEFMPEQIHNIVNHSDAKLLFVGDVVATQVDATKMPGLEGIIYIPDYSLVVSRTDKLTYAREHLNEMFGIKYPKYFRKNHVNYYIDQDPNELAMINYTSGTTGFSKGVMVPYRALWSNADFAENVLGKKIKAGDSIISILPMAHMYGMAFEFVFEFIKGCHIYYLTRIPSPAIIAEAFGRIKPSVIIAVPLVIEKIIRKKVFPKIQNNRMRMLLHMPVISKKVKEKICDQVSNAFGGNFYEVIIGGAAFNQEVERFLHGVGFKYTVGYGATECAPIICYEDYKNFVPGSCGKAALHMMVRIDSPDPENVPGEILAKGPNVMLGYYKNEEATKQTIDENGWYHSGDLGTMDGDGNVFIKGRSKNMLLGASGQNIYPEEIEDKLNSLALVAESVVIQKGDKLVALVYPDFDEAQSLNLGRSELELWQFFGSFGGGGLLGVLAAMALLAVFGLALMYIISRTGIAEMDAVLVPWERLAWLRKLSSALQLILLFGVIAIMYAGGGALLEQLFSLPTWLGRTLMAVLVTLVALRGLRGAVGAFSLIVPVIVALTLLFGGMALARYGVSLPAFGAAEGSNPLMRSAAFGAVTFAFYNFFGSVGILAPLGEAASSKRAARRGVLLGTALLLLIAYSVLLAVMAVPETADAELPMLALAYGLSRPLGYVYGILLLLCMYGSALSMTVAITTYASARSERVEKRRGWFILALGALGYAASSVGFGDLISVV